MDRFIHNACPWSQTLYDVLHYFQDNSEYIKNLLQSTDGYDAFLRHQTAAHIDILKNYILQSIGKTELDNDTIIYIQMYVYATVHTIAAWLNGSIECDVTHLGQLFENTMSDPLRIYFY